MALEVEILTLRVSWPSIWQLKNGNLKWALPKRSQYFTTTKIGYQAEPGCEGLALYFGHSVSLGLISTVITLLCHHTWWFHSVVFFLSHRLSLAELLSLKYVRPRSTKGLVSHQYKACNYNSYNGIYVIVEYVNYTD